MPENECELSIFMNNPPPSTPGAVGAYCESTATMEIDGIDCPAPGSCGSK